MKTASIETLRAANPKLSDEKLELLKGILEQNTEVPRPVNPNFGIAGEINRCYATGYDYCTPLGLAARFGYLNVVRDLLDQGADPNFLVRDGTLEQTPLNLALASEHWEIGYVLIDRGASVNAAPYAGITPLMLAAARGNRRFVRKLLSMSAIPDSETDAGETAIAMLISGAIHLSEKEVSEIVEILVAGGVPTTDNSENISMSSTLKERGFDQLADRLLHM